MGAFRAPARSFVAICGIIEFGSGVPGLLHRHRRFYRKVPGRFSHFLERARIDLPDAFTRYVELGREVFQRRWFVDQMARLEDTTFSIVQHADCGNQRLAPVVLVVLFDDDGFR